MAGLATVFFNIENTVNRVPRPSWREQKEVDMIGRVRNGVITAALTASMIACGVPVAAVADESGSSLQARIADARAHFDELALASAEAGECLNDTRYALDQTRESIGVVNGQVETAKAELDAARDVLADRVAANYRAGARSLYLSEWGK